MALAPASAYYPSMANAIISALFRRASELADTGAYSGCEAVVRHLREEGCLEAAELFRDQSLRVQIDLHCKKAFNAKES